MNVHTREKEFAKLNSTRVPWSTHCLEPSAPRLMHSENAIRVILLSMLFSRANVEIISARFFLHRQPQFPSSSRSQRLNAQTALTVDSPRVNGDMT